MMVVIGSGLVAVTAAQQLLNAGHDVILTTSHAEFGFPHGGCGLWDTTNAPWPLETLEEAVATASGDLVTCRSQWLVKRLVHRFTEHGGRTSTRVRINEESGTFATAGTGTFAVDEAQHFILADQDVPEPGQSIGTPLVIFKTPVVWYGAVMASNTQVDVPHAGRRADGSIEAWTTEQSELTDLQSSMLETMTTTWEHDEWPLDAARMAKKALKGVDAFLTSNALPKA